MLERIDFVRKLQAKLRRKRHCCFDEVKVQHEQASSHETILSRCTSPSCHTGASDQTAMLHGHALHQQKQLNQINRKPQQDTHPPDKRRQINSNAQVALSKVLEGMVVPHIIAD